MRVKNAWDRLIDIEIKKIIEKQKSLKKWMKEYEKADDATKLKMLKPK